MSSSSSYRPSHLHRVNLQSNGKRPFEECGYDSDPDPSSLNSGTQPSGSGGSGSSHHFSSGSSSSTGAGDGRNKRARSTSSSSNSGHSSSSDVSTSTGYDTAPSSSRSDLSLSGPSALARDAVDCPISAPALFDSQDESVANLSIELPRSTFTAGIPETASVSSEDNLRSSLQRFNEFERHIAALRSSIATSRPSLLPQMGSSEHAPHEDWHAGSSTFQPMNSGGLTAPDTSDESTSTIQDDTFSSMSSFGSTNGMSTTHPSASSTGGGLYPFQYNNLSPPYSPMSGRPSAEGERSGATIGSSHVPPGMESTRTNVGIRQPSGSRLSPPPPPPQLRPTRRSPSPLVLEPAVSPSSSDDTSLTSNRVVDSDLRLPVTRGRRDDISPAGFFDRQAGEISHQFGTGDDRLTTAHLIHAESQAERATPDLAEIRHRVLRQHSAERGPTPSVFDVFRIGDSLFEHDVTRRSQSPARDRAAVSVRVPSSTVDTRAGASEFRMHGRTPNILSSSTRSSFHPRLYSMPSTNSLMSENAAEQRQMIAREHFWAPFYESSLDLPGYTSDDSHSDGQPPGFTDSPPRTEGFMRSGVGQESGHGRSGRGEEQTLHTTSTERGSELAAVRRPENPFGSDPRPFVPHPSDGQGASIPPTPESGHAFFLESSSHPGEWSPPPISPQHRAQRTGPPYSYDSLNLEPFHSGIFRDSLRRSVEVRRPSPVSRFPSWALDDSDSSDEIDFDIIRSRRPSSPALRDRLRAFATVVRSQRLGASNRTGPEPTSANDESSMSRQRAQANTRGPVGSIPFSSQNVVGGAQPSNLSATAGARSNRMSPPVRFTDHMAHRNQREDGGRRRNSTLGHPRPNTNLTPRPERIVVDDEPASRRPFGGGILQRLANFQRPSDGPLSSLPSQTGTRVVPPPLGARPALPRHRRVIPPDPMDDDDRPSPMSRNSITPLPTLESARRQSIAWHPFLSDGRGSEASEAIPGSTALPTRESVPLSSLEGHALRHHAPRQRAQLDRGGAPMQRMHRPSVWRSAALRRNFGAGDYVPDEFFDTSYEALLSLSDAIGEVHSKATPEDVIESLQSAMYKEWAREDSEMRCPICLDDYEPSDVVTKLLECPHWLHKHCLEQWLRTANTCPVCRKKVKSSPSPRRGCPYQRSRSASTPGTSNEAGQNDSILPPSGSQSNFRISVVSPATPFVSPGNLRTAVPSRQQPQMSRATRPVPTPVEMETPNSIQSRAAREENRSLDHLTHPDHRHAVYGVIPQHSHVPHHTHIRPPRPLASRPLPSQVHPVVYVHRQTEELREPRGVASEQLIVPRTPPTDGNNDNQFPPTFHSLGSSLFHMDGSRPRVPQADIGTRLHASEAGPNSSLTPSALSSLVHPTPPSSTYVTSRADAPSTLSSIQNEMAIRNNHQFATNLTIEHTEMPHQPVHPDATGYSHVPPQADTARSRGQDTNVRWRMRSSSIPVRDDVSRQNTGLMYPWMAQ